MNIMPTKVDKITENKLQMCVYHIEFLLYSYTVIHITNIY